MWYVFSLLPPVLRFLVTYIVFSSVGHLFCHQCIVDAVRYDEEQRAESSNGKPTRGKCPACRKLLSRKDTPGQKRDLIPLQLKLATKKRPS
jgi:hypothetical protein